MLQKKIKNKGIKWFFWRMRSEFRTPTKAITKSIMDGSLRMRKKLSDSQKDKNEDELLYAIFDLKITPITFNIVEFLISSEYEASQSGKKGFIVVFVPEGKALSYGWEEYDSLFDSDQKLWKFHNIVLPITLLAAKCQGFYILPRRSDISNFIKNKDIHPNLYDGVNLRYIDIVDFWSKLDRPGLVEGLRATKQGLRYIENWRSTNKVVNPVVSITIRQNEFDKARNSNIEEWVKFAHYLQDSGYFPVIVPDTESAFQTTDAMSELYVFNEGSWNMGLRMALYESAYLNFFGLNGPAYLAHFNSKCSYISLNYTPQGSIVTTKEARKKVGQSDGKNYKFALPYQRNILTIESYESIVEEFERFVDDDKQSKFG